MLHAARFSRGNFAIDAGGTKHAHKEMMPLEYGFRKPPSPLCKHYIAVLNYEISQGLKPRKSLGNTRLGHANTASYLHSMHGLAGLPLDHQHSFKVVFV